MSIKRSIAAAAAIAALTVPVFAKDAVVQSLWAAKPLTIDGVAKDWDDATPLSDKASGAQYAVKNDGKDLYIIVVLRDPISRSTIDFTGMKVYTTSGAKKAKEAGLLFRQKQISADEFIASLEKKGEALTDARKAELRKQKGYTVFEVTHADAKKEAPAPEQAHFRALQTGQVAVYEFMIPLGDVGQEGGPAAPGGAIKIGFEWGGMTKEITKTLMANRAASGAAVREGAAAMTVSDSSGDGGGGGGPDFSFNRDPRYKKHAFWIDVKLAAEAK